MAESLTTHSPEETAKVAGIFIENLLAAPGIPGTATIVALSGDLGAGKTTFTKGAAQAFGITETVTSPTFVIEKIYSLTPTRGPFTRLIHIDAYRLDDPKELESIGWYDIATDPLNIILIEWPEQAESLIPARAWRVNLSHISENERAIEIVPPAS